MDFLRRFLSRTFYEGKQRKKNHQEILTTKTATFSKCIDAQPFRFNLLQEALIRISEHSLIRSWAATIREISTACRTENVILALFLSHGPMWDNR